MPKYILGTKRCCLDIPQLVRLQLQDIFRQLTPLNILKYLSCTNLLQISQKCHHMQFSYQEDNTEKMGGELQAAAQNQFFGWQPFCTEDLKLRARGQKSLYVCSTQCRWLNVRLTKEKPLPYYHMYFLNTPEQGKAISLPALIHSQSCRKREQRWKWKESRWLSGIIGWIYPNLLCTELDIVQMKCTDIHMESSAMDPGRITCSATWTWPLPRSPGTKLPAVSDPAHQSGCSNMVIKLFWK